MMASAMSVAAQDTLLVQGNAPDLYLTHTVKKGETWYSLGRAYGLSPKDIAAKNRMQMDQGLSLGKQITIPLNKNNFIQSKDAQSGAGVRPVYHKVAEKETLYRIHVRYAKVPLDNVRQWNHITGDGVQKDAYLVVGFVKGNGQSAVLASAAPRTETVSRPPAAEPVASQQQPAAPVATRSQTAEPETRPAPPSQPAAPESKPVASTQPTEPETRPAPRSQAAEPEARRETSLGRTPSIPEGGFEQIYMQQTNNGRSTVTEKGPGTWFRSNAVVGSGKYYALHNSAPRGTILKVTNPLTGRSIYAKVLDAIPQLKANANLIIKLSDAAQDALGITEGRFYCELNYDEK